MPFADGNELVSEAPWHMFLNADPSSKHSPKLSRKVPKKVPGVVRDASKHAVKRQEPEVIVPQLSILTVSSSKLSSRGGIQCSGDNAKNDSVAKSGQAETMRAVVDAFAKAHSSVLHCDNDGDMPLPSEFEGGASASHPTLSFKIFGGGENFEERVYGSSWDNQRSPAREVDVAARERRWAARSRAGEAWASPMQLKVKDVKSSKGGDALSKDLLTASSHPWTPRPRKRTAIPDVSVVEKASSGAESSNGEVNSMDKEPGTTHRVMQGSLQSGSCLGSSDIDSHSKKADIDEDGDAEGSVRKVFSIVSNVPPILPPRDSPPHGVTRPIGDGSMDTDSAVNRNVEESKTILSLRDLSEEVQSELPNPPTQHSGKFSVSPLPVPGKATRGSHSHGRGEEHNSLATIARSAFAQVQSSGKYDNVGSVSPWDENPSDDYKGSPLMKRQLAANGKGPKHYVDYCLSDAIPHSPHPPTSARQESRESPRATLTPRVGARSPKDGSMLASLYRAKSAPSGDQFFKNPRISPRPMKSPRALPPRVSAVRTHNMEAEEYINKAREGMSAPNRSFKQHRKGLSGDHPPKPVRKILRPGQLVALGQSAPKLELNPALEDLQGCIQAQDLSDEPCTVADETSEQVKADNPRTHIQVRFQNVEEIAAQVTISPSSSVGRIERTASIGSVSSFASYMSYDSQTYYDDDASDHLDDDEIPLESNESARDREEEEECSHITASVQDMLTYNTFRADRRSCVTPRSPRVVVTDTKNATLGSATGKSITHSEKIRMRSLRRMYPSWLVSQGIVIGQPMQLKGTEMAIVNTRKDN